AFSTIINPDDRTTAAIFGDGAGAVVLRAGHHAEPGAVGPCVLGSDGEQSGLIRIPAGGARQKTTDEPTDRYFQMVGRDTYRHAVERTSAVALAALKRAGWAPDDVDRFAAHQANARIVDSVADRLGIPESNRLANIEHIGNTAAASVPLLLAESTVSGALLPGDRTLLAAFGGGLTWGATTVIWPEITALVGVASDAD
ncbi:MAG TPA: 3-oxoacyl-[acyl-carrier-protein] synthase III C-terminal domain-containing protein, partial [Pseudonocardiaceae bacterium]